MKNLIDTALLFLFFLIQITCFSQVSLTYSLNGNFEENQNLHNDLIPLNNDNGENGFFGELLVPSTTCPDTFSVDGYYFYDNAGLEFENNQFIDCEYSIQFTFNVSDFSGPEGWVRLLNFTPNDDNGIYINISNLTNGTLEFWPNGTVGTTGFFNTIDLYQFVMTRTCNGLVNIYINGEFFASYDDSGSSLYLINPSDDVIVFFQDDPQVGNEASPGWVKNITISNYPLSTATILQEWEDFCDILQEIDCAGVANGTSVIDDCGICLEPTDPTFNQSCVDCVGVANGTSVIDDCGICLESTDPNFNQSCKEENLIYIPNAFSPNDDGYNDKFQVFKNHEINAQVNQYLIFNRWGDLVFEAKNFDINSNSNWWNGEFRGKKVNAGIYVYYIEIEFEDGDLKKYMGDLTIVK